MPVCWAVGGRAPTTERLEPTMASLKTYTVTRPDGAQFLMRLDNDDAANYGKLDGWEVKAGDHRPKPEPEAEPEAEAEADEADEPEAVKPATRTAAKTSTK